MALLFVNSVMQTGWMLKYDLQAHWHWWWASAPLNKQAGLSETVLTASVVYLTPNIQHDTAESSLKVLECICGH